MTFFKIITCYGGHTTFIDAIEIDTLRVNWPPKTLRRLRVNLRRCKWDVYCTNRIKRFWIKLNSVITTSWRFAEHFLHADVLLRNGSEHRHCPTLLQMSLICLSLEVPTLMEVLMKNGDIQPSMDTSVPGGGGTWVNFAGYVSLASQISIIDSILVTVGQMCHFRILNLVTLYLINP